MVDSPLGDNPKPPVLSESATVEVIRDLEHLPASLRGGAVAIGNFDGVHLGHARIVARLRQMAAAVGGPAVVFTFDPPPARLLHPEQAPAPLCWLNQKLALLEGLRLDAVLVYPTDEAFLRLEPRAFFDHFVLDRLAARAMVEGSNFFFGRRRQGNVDLLRSLCTDSGRRLDVVEPGQIDGQPGSSSRVRGAVFQGRVEDARQLLGRPYRIRGTVIRGAGRGRTLGYPTANLAQVPTLLPAEGIYAGRALVAGTPWPAAISLGPNPTIGEGRLKVEVFLVGYEGDLYGQPLEVDFLGRLRDIVRFEGVEQLLVQMGRDVASTLTIVAQDSTPPGPLQDAIR